LATLSMTRPQWETWIRSLPQPQLRQEIEREKDHLATIRNTITEVSDNINETMKEIEDEKLVNRTRRIEARKRRIEQLRRIINEWNKQINDTRAKTRRIEDLIHGLQSQIEQSQAEMRFYTYPGVSRPPWYIRADRERDVQAIRRSISAYKGHITRDSYILSKLTEFRASDLAELAANNRWLRLESSLRDRLALLNGQIEYWTQQLNDLRRNALDEDERIQFKSKYLITVKLGRVAVNYYLVIDAGEKEYEYRRKGGGKVHVKRKYPKGQFQAWLDVDSFIDGDGEIEADKDPFLTLDGVMRKDVADEFMELFNLKDVDMLDLTLGIVSNIVDSQDLGKPPFKLRVERTVQGAPGGQGSWGQQIEEYLMTTEEYDRFTANMTEYREALRNL